MAIELSSSCPFERSRVPSGENASYDYQFYSSKRFLKNKKN